MDVRNPLREKKPDHANSWEEKRDKVDREKKGNKKEKEKKTGMVSQYVWNFLLRTQHGRTSGTDSNNLHGERNIEKGK